MFREKLEDGTTKLTGSLATFGDVMNILNPVGKIYMSVDPTDPGTLFGGTWEAWGVGQFIVGVDDSQTEFDSVEESGGSKTHTHGVSNTALGQVSDVTTGGTGARLRTPDPHNHTLTTNSHLPPYITCYMWKRTA